MFYLSVWCLLFRAIKYIISSVAPLNTDMNYELKYAGFYASAAMLITFSLFLAFTLRRLILSYFDI
jgi:hypothetical protein